MLLVGLKDKLSMRLDGGCGPLTTSRQGRDLALLLETLVAADRAGRTDTKALGCLSARGSRFDRRDHPLSQIQR